MFQKFHESELSKNNRIYAKCVFLGKVTYKSQIFML